MVDLPEVVGPRRAPVGIYGQEALADAGSVGFGGRQGRIDFPLDAIIVLKHALPVAPATTALVAGVNRDEPFVERSCDE
jgi:hypothetical protein